MKLPNWWGGWNPVEGHAVMKPGAESGKSLASCSGLCITLGEEADEEVVTGIAQIGCWENRLTQDFLVSPVIKTLCTKCRVMGSISDLGISHRMNGVGKNKQKTRLTHGTSIKRTWTVDKISSWGGQPRGQPVSDGCPDGVWEQPVASTLESLSWPQPSSPAAGAMSFLPSAGHCDAPWVTPTFFLNSAKITSYIYILLGSTFPSQ